MKKLTDKDGEVRQITEADTGRFKKVDAALAKGIKRLRGQRGRQKAPIKAPVSLRLNPDVIEHFKKGGKGWQARINAVLEKDMEKRPKGKPY